MGVAHQFHSSGHYGPYYNQADSAGLGFDRSPTGSDFVAQYFPALEQRYGNIDTVPENLMMWFHHVRWGHRMDSGRSFWDELVLRYQMGIQYVTWMREAWESLEGDIGARRFAEVQAKLAAHEADAADWRDTSVSYWQGFGGFDASAASYAIPVPAGASPRITRVSTARGARYRILEQAAGVPGRAVVQVRSESFFGPIVKNYVFEMSSR